MVSLELNLCVWLLESGRSFEPTKLWEVILALLVHGNPYVVSDAASCVRRCSSGLLELRAGDQLLVICGMVIERWWVMPRLPRCRGNLLVTWWNNFGSVRRTMSVVIKRVFLLSTGVVIVLFVSVNHDCWGGQGLLVTSRCLSRDTRLPRPKMRSIMMGVRGAAPNPKFRVVVGDASLPDPLGVWSGSQERNGAVAITHATQRNATQRTKPHKHLPTHQHHHHHPPSGFQLAPLAQKAQTCEKHFFLTNFLGTGSSPCFPLPSPPVPLGSTRLFLAQKASKHWENLCPPLHTDFP